MISIIIPWFNRKELKEALPTIMLNAKNVEGEVIIVNFNGDKSFLNTLLLNEEKNLSVIHIENGNEFNKPTAQNIGAYHSSFDYLFFCDCDIYFPDLILKDLITKIKKQKNIFATLKEVKETQQNARKAENLVMFGYHLKLKIADGTEVMIVDNEEDVSLGTRQAPGLLLVNKKDFLSIDGYNSGLDGWGWEDQDIICRLSLSAKLKRMCWGNALHISHDDNSRMLGYKNYEDRWHSRDIMFRRALENYNQGNFKGTYSTDIERFTKNKNSKTNF